VFFWYVGMSVLLVANVFRSTGVDYRLIAVGALLPLVVDAPVGHQAFGHTLAFAVLLLVVVMVTTIGRPRLLRRRLLCIPIGVFFGLLLSGAWTTDGFWWPFTAWDHADLLPAWWAVVAEELTGLFACWWVIGQFDLYLPGPRREFWRSGRLKAVAQ
jgi:hypothetical protein